MAKYYRPSGKFSPLAFVGFIALALFVFPVLSSAYALAIRFVPFIYIRVLLTVGFGFSISYLVSKVIIRFGQIRNGRLAFGMGALSSLFSYYFHWVVWIVVLFRSVGSSEESMGVFAQITNLALDPGTLIDMVRLLNITGTWGVGDSATSGFFLGFIWVVEAVIIIGMGILFSWAKFSDPFDESTGKWITPETLPPMAFIGNPDVIRLDLESGKNESIEALPVQFGGHMEDHSLFGLYLSENGENYLTITNRKKKVDDEGKVTFDETTIVDQICVNRELVSVLKGKWKK